MSTKYRPHLLVLPEDDANRQIANGFMLHHALEVRAIQVLPVAGGWERVVDRFKDTHIGEMRRYSKRRILLVVDFDDEPDQRFLLIRKKIPGDLKDRVFILGTRSRPKELRIQTGESLESIGKALAEDCADNTRKTWGHDLLIHNSSELDRLYSCVKPFLFS